MHKTILAILIFLHGSYTLKGQAESNIEETVSFINSRFLNSPIIQMNSSATFKKVMVEPNGKIHVSTRQHTFCGGELEGDDISFFPKDVDFAGDSLKDEWRTSNLLSYEDFLKLEAIVYEIVRNGSLDSVAAVKGDFWSKYGHKPTNKDKLYYMRISRLDSRIPTAQDGQMIILSYQFLDGSIIKAFKQLADLINSDASYTQNEIVTDIAPADQAEEVNETTKESPSIIQMKLKSSGVFEIPVEINGVLKISFIFDSGASDVSISPDVALTLIRTKTIAESDFVGTNTYKFADGSISESDVLVLHELKIGNKTIKNVKASISSSIKAPMLLGQSALQKLGKFTIDNVSQTITIE